MARILVVEDNEMNLDVLKRRLERIGHVVLHAEDGLRGIEMATAEGPDLVLMDISLPGIDGWEATRRLLADPRTTDLPIIALTAHAMAEDRAKSLAAGCIDYDTKPVDFARLVAKINRVLAVEIRA